MDGHQLFRPVFFLLFFIYGALGCNNAMGYRNFWVEAYSTTPCGELNSPPVGVCSMEATCSAMAGESMGRHNCPPTASVCCRPKATCSASTAALNMLWESEEYNSIARMEATDCSLSVVTASDTCFIRVDFDDLDLQSNTVDECAYSHLTITGQKQGDGGKICGTLNHKTTFVAVAHRMIGLPAPVTFRLRMDHVPHKYRVRFNHIKCDAVKNFRKTRSSRELIHREEKSMRSRPVREELDYMGRLFAVSYTREPLIRSCPVTFIAEDIALGSASCSLRLGGPGVSKGLMVVHGAAHTEPKTYYPRTVGSLAQYVAANGVVVKRSIFHPMYNHETHEHDLAIYFLNKTIPSAKSVLLPVPVDDFVDLSVYMSRYRYYEMSDDVTILSNPEEVLTKVVSNTNCRSSSLLSVSAVSTNDTICLAATKREHTPCEGEVGSPIIHLGGSGAITLLGLMMGGYHNCKGDRTYPEPALKMINYLDFINVATSPRYTIQSPPDDSTLFGDVYTTLFG